jgi:predicted DCC family thiol-disulfide oxidoreductase YuxK
VANWKLFYDGGCNLCHVSQLRAEKWAHRVHQPLDVDVLLSDEGIAKGYRDEMVLEADGRVYKAADAWMKLMTIAPWYLRWVAMFGKTKATMAVAKWFYGIVAKYRYKWFGTRECRVSRVEGPNSSGLPRK